MQKISCLRCCVFSVLVSGLLKAQFEATSVYNPNSRPIFSLDVETRHAQYFTYSPVVASGKMVFPLHLLPSLKLQEYFYACITSACMRIARQPIELMPETVCSNANTLHRTDLQSFICNNRDDLIDDHGGKIGIIRFKTIELGYANLFHLGHNVWTMKVFDNENKETLLGVDTIEFVVIEAPLRFKHLEFQLIAEKGEAVADIAIQFCHAVNDFPYKEDCIQNIMSNVLYDLNHSLVNELYNPSQVQIDVTSVYSFAATHYMPQEIIVNGVSYQVQIDSDYRVGMCWCWNDVCKENNFSTPLCSGIVANVLASMKEKDREHMLDNPYFSQVDLSRLHQRYNNLSKRRFEANILDVVHLIMSDENMKPSVRENIISLGGWGMGRDVLFFNQRELFKTLLSLFDSNHQNFRPCMEWLIITLDETFVKTDALKAVLRPLSSQRPIYLGYPHKIPKASQACRYSLSEDFIALDVNFASFSGGIVLSRGLLDLLRVKIMPEVRTIAMGHDITRSYCYDFDVNDARLGHCIAESLGIPLTVDSRFGGTIKSAPACSSKQENSLGDYVTVPYATPGQPCREQRNSTEVQTVLSSIIRVMTTYEKDRHNALESIRLHVNSSTYRLTPNVQYRFNTSQIMVFDDPGVDSKLYPPGIQLRETPPCTDKKKSFACLQEKMSLAVYAVSHYVQTNEHIQYGIFGDCDQSLNLLGIAETLAERIDPNRPLMAGDVKWGHSQYPYVSGGGYVHTRAWFLAYHKFASQFYEQHGVLPLMGHIYDRLSINGIQGCDSYYTYVTFRMGGDVVHLPGWHGFSSLCMLPRDYWHDPVLSLHGLVSNKTVDSRYGSHINGPVYLHEADAVYEAQERQLQNKLVEREN
jgi:hypothetical protein